MPFFKIFDNESTAHLQGITVELEGPTASGPTLFHYT
jgi:hypothetical protein